MKTIYLHIGSPKTGTSALQYFLLQNRPVLHQKGFEYPAHEVDANGISSGNGYEFVRLIQDRSPELGKFAGALFNTECPRIILSSEGFFMIGEPEISRIGELLAGADVRVIVYFRRQDFMMISIFQQGIKRHGFKESMQQYFERFQARPYFYQKKVEQWANVFGREHILVRPYEQQQYAGGTIFSDFLHLLGLETEEAFAMPAKKINPGYRIDALEAKRLLNGLPSLARRLWEVDKILQNYSERLGSEGDWPYSLLSPAQRIHLCQSHEWINATIARNYLGRGNGRLFYDPLPDPDEPWEAYPGLSEQAMQHIFQFIAEQSPSISRKITDAVQKEMQSGDPQVRRTAELLSPVFRVSEYRS